MFLRAKIGGEGAAAISHNTVRAESGPPKLVKAGQTAVLWQQRRQQHWQQVLDFLNSNSWASCVMGNHPSSESSLSAKAPRRGVRVLAANPALAPHRRRLPPMLLPPLPNALPC